MVQYGPAASTTRRSTSWSNPFRDGEAGDVPQQRSLQAMRELPKVLIHPRSSSQTIDATGWSAMGNQSRAGGPNRLPSQQTTCAERDTLFYRGGSSARHLSVTNNPRK